MSLLISLLLIHHMGLSWGWYGLAVAIYGVRVAASVSNALKKSVGGS